MNDIEHHIDELYPILNLKRHEFLDYIELCHALNNLQEKRWSNISLHEFDLELLLELNFNLIHNNTLLFRDYWRNAIKQEILSRINK